MLAFRRQIGPIQTTQYYIDLIAYSVGRIETCHVHLGCKFVKLLVKIKRFRSKFHTLSASVNSWQS